MNTATGGGWLVGSTSVTPVHELTDAGPVIQAGFPDATPEQLRAMPWLQPHFADGCGTMHGAVQAFVVEAGGKIVLVDTGIGNGKPRPGIDAWSGLATDFLGRLAGHGLTPADVDIVVCTHMHFDHVGWNTTSADDRWVPTFPQARHLVTREEFDYWRTEPAEAQEYDRIGFADSVLPVFEAGLLDLVAPDHSVCPGVRLLPTPGHTPGHVSVLVESGDEQAVITGDAIHHPCQIVHPEWSVRADRDPEQARRSRVELLGRCADSGMLLIGSHFAAPAGVTVRRDGAGFQVTA